METSEAICLHFEDEGSWYCLPEWAEYFISLGRKLAEADRGGGRLVVALALPTRAYAAAFVSLGMVISDAANRDEESESDHFQKLLALRPGTAVLYRKKNRPLKGLISGTQELNGKTYVRVQVHSDAGGGLTYLVSQETSLEVQPAPGKTWQLPQKQSGGRIGKADAFVDALLSGADPAHLGLRSKMVCALVGRRNTLEHEVRKTPLAIHVNDSQYAVGYLQDVLRVRRFVSPQQDYRSALVTLGKRPPSADTLARVEKGVVYDGAVGFLKWGSMWEGRHQVAVLDRTEPYFQDAISAINERFARHGAQDGAIDPEGDTPPGGEILVFREPSI